MAASRLGRSSYPIGTLARLSGVSAHALRIWERRYGAFVPIRTPKGARRYSERDVERARLLKSLTALGHSIGSIAQLPDAELRGFATGKRGRGPGNSASLQSTRAVRELLVSAAVDVDAERASRALRQAASQLAPRETIVSVIGPALTKIGEHWERGELGVAGEHTVSAVIRSFLGHQLEQSAFHLGSPIVCATPAGELHELGALSVAVVAHLHGCPALYAGPNLPAEEVARAARLSNACAVALSAIALQPEVLGREIRVIEHLLPPNVALILGGGAATRLGSTFARGLVLSDLTEFEAWMSTRKFAAE